MAETKPDDGAVMKAIRGPHAERTRAMRARLIETAVDCLHELGYGATTFQVVTDRAGVSRGAILHHFPTRIDLMVAVAEYAARFQNRVVEEAVDTAGKELQLFLSVTRATWQAMMQPPAMAMLEVMLATRADPVLAERIREVVAEFEGQQRDNVWLLAGQLGIRDRARIDAMIRLHRAAMRGLALELSLTGDGAAAAESMDLLFHYKRLLTGEMLTAEE